MPQTFFDLNLLVNIVAKLGSIVGEHVNFDMFANNVGQFDHTFTILQRRYPEEQYPDYPGAMTYKT